MILSPTSTPIPTVLIQTFNSTLSLLAAANSTTNNTIIDGTEEESEDDEPLAVSLGMFAAILFGSLLFIFILLGVCVLWHTFYMKFLKKRNRPPQQAEQDDKPKVVLDLSHQLDEIEPDDDFEKKPVRRVLPEVEENTQETEMVNEVDRMKSSQIVSESAKTPEQSNQENHEKPSQQNEQSHVNLAFVNSNLALSQTSDKSGQEKIDERVSSSKKPSTPPENYVNLSISQL